jgi:ATP-dependent Clp protease ATP-binding subunit ClpA
MFERFSDQARQVMMHAEQEARALNHRYIGTEHLLLGLLREQGVACRVLESLDVDLDRARATVIGLVGAGSGETDEDIPLTSHGRKVLEYALDEAVRRGHDQIGPEHILLGLVRETDGRGSEALRELTNEPGEIHSRVLETIREPDSGDLLTMLLKVPDGVAARALAELGFNAQALDAALARARAAAPDADGDALEPIRRRLGIGSGA